MTPPWWFLAASAVPQRPPDRRCALRLNDRRNAGLPMGRRGTPCRRRRGRSARNIGFRYNNITKEQT